MYLCTNKQIYTFYACENKEKFLKVLKMMLKGILRPAVIKLTLKIWKYNLNFPSYTVSTFPDFQGDFECSSRNILTVHCTMFPIYQIVIIAFQRFYRIGLLSLLDYSLVICLLLDACNSKNPCQYSMRFIWLLTFWEKINKLKVVTIFCKIFFSVFLLLFFFRRTIFQGQKVLFSSQLTLWNW